MANTERKQWREDIWKHLFLVMVCVLILYPFLMMLQMSLKDVGQIMYEFFRIKPPFHWENYVRAWQEVRPFIFNSFYMAVLSAVLAVLVAALGGYGFARMRFPGSQVLFYIIFAKMLLPAVINLIPAFVLAWKLGLLDSYWAVILFAVAGAQPFWVFVMRTFVAQQPGELFEAAKVDGATETQCFWYVALPLLRPMLILMSINTFLAVWNDYIWPLVTIQTPAKRPITVGLAYLTTGFAGDWGPLMAGYVLASIPLIILFVSSMRWYIEGLTAGAIKL